MTVRLVVCCYDCAVPVAVDGWYRSIYFLRERGRVVSRCGRVFVWFRRCCWLVHNILRALWLVFVWECCFLWWWVHVVLLEVDAVLVADVAAKWGRRCHQGGSGSTSGVSTSAENLLLGGLLLLFGIARWVILFAWSFAAVEWSAETFPCSTLTVSSFTTSIVTCSTIASLATVCACSVHLLICLGCAIAEEPPPRSQGRGLCIPETPEQVAGPILVICWCIGWFWRCTAVPLPTWFLSR